MSTTKKTPAGVQISTQNEGNKLDAIRTILLGEQKQITELRIAELKKSIELLEKALGQAESKFSDRLIALEGAYAEKQETFQNEFTQKLNDFAEKANQNSKDQRNEIGAMLIELGSKIQG